MKLQTVLDLTSMKAHLSVLVTFFIPTRNLESDETKRGSEIHRLNFKIALLKVTQIHTWNYAAEVT